MRKPYDFSGSQTPTNTSQSPGPWGFVAGVLVACAVFWGVNNYDSDWFGFNQDGDQGEQIDDDQKEQSGETLRSKTAGIYLIDETSDRQQLPFLVTLQNNTGYWDALDAAGIKSRFADPDVEQLDAKYKAAVATVGTPCVLFLADDGSVIYSKTTPPTTAAIDDLLDSKTKDLPR